MAKICLVSAARNCITNSLLHPVLGKPSRRYWFLFSAWMLAIQYCDYPFDNHKVPFKEMRTALRTRKITNMQFGALTSLFTMIPLLNLFIMPVAVCGATAMWVDCYRDKHAMWR